LTAHRTLLPTTDALDPLANYPEIHLGVVNTGRPRRWSTTSFQVNAGALSRFNDLNQNEAAPLRTRRRVRRVPILRGRADVRYVARWTSRSMLNPVTPASMRCAWLGQSSAAVLKRTQTSTQRSSLKSCASSSRVGLPENSTRRSLGKSANGGSTLAREASSSGPKRTSP
jgi:hypothetical protein